ncbi:MAG: N-acetylmuramoyl-L-alanine amidase family 2 [Firmicutes bacterium]|nr:N-acetylmuramoyl-L-alanine amidase family 2 [Bacillota bacterium]
MNRRSFLQKSFAISSALWLGQYALFTSNIFAAEPLAHFRYIRNGVESKPEHNQAYFWMEIAISNVCEIVETSSPNYFEFIIKQCNAGKYAGLLSPDNPFVKSIEIITQKAATCLIRFNLKTDTSPELRYSLEPQIIFKGAYCLRIDIGLFSAATAIKESQLKVQESNLAFSPLATRAATDLLVIHHIGLTDAEVSAATVHQWHLANGWAGIGYHYVIHKNGNMERGRPREAVGAHTLHHNETSIGINLVGNFEEAVPTDAQIDTAAKLVAALCHIYTLSPDETTLLGHRDLNDTLCPGKSLYELLPQLREKALNYWEK